VQYFAHSGVSARGIAPQHYEDHILNVYSESHRLMGILTPLLQKATLLAALNHDLGKLIPSSQKVLGLSDKLEGAHLVNHVDAGVAWCLKKYQATQDMAWLYAAYLIHSHHIGLQNKNSLYHEQIVMLEREISFAPGFRDTHYSEILAKPVSNFFDGILDKLNAIQISLFKEQIESVERMSYTKTSIKACDLRFALSILVEADHGDSARHQGQPRTHSYPLRAKERLEKLNEIVQETREAALAKGIPLDTVDSRSQLFNICSSVDISDNKFFVCAAPVGKGKTYGLADVALRIASEKNKERVFFLIPFTNIISQSVANYRSLALPGENPKYIVNEIHSKVEYSSYYSRVYSHAWNAPINVSTSVQFFDSLFSNRPSALRKLHNFANSVIVFDEFHNALLHHLWQVALILLKDISVKYNIDFIFGSGTHVFYWDIFPNVGLEVKSIVPDSIFEEFMAMERKRIRFVNLGILSSDEAFYRIFHQAALTPEGDLLGSTIIVLNTVMNALIMTHWFKQAHPDWTIFHMSSCLTPADREVILAKVHNALKGSRPILLIATSVVECGVDFTFFQGFRERGSLLSTLQFGGRVNRNKEQVQGVVYEFSFKFDFLKDSSFTFNPSIRQSILARDGVPVDPDNCTNVIEREIEETRGQSLIPLETSYSFKDMSEQFQVIPDNTVSVLVDQELWDKILAGEIVNPVEINRNSVSIYLSKLDPTKDNNLCQWVEQKDDMYSWKGSYDHEIYGIYLDDFDAGLR